MRFPAALLVLACCACSHGAPSAEREARPVETGARRYDLVPRGYDPNGFSLDPEFGWWFNRHSRCGGADQDADPSTCSWRFEEGAIPEGACNSRPLDPDLSDHWSTWLFGITCSDSPLLYTGHLNWGDAYHGAVTYGGTLSWQEYASNDHDLNFYFEPDRGPSPGFAIGVEIDQRDVAGFHAPWFVRLNTEVLIGGKQAPAAWVGRRKAVVTGLLGIDAEHMSARSLNVELHPVFAMAVQTRATGKNEVWTVFARDGGNEGFCSHQSREHAVEWPDRKYRADLPLDCEPDETPVPANLCSDRGGASASVTIDPRRAAALLTIGVPEGATVEGEVHIRCKRPRTRAAPEEGKAPAGMPLDRRFLGTQEEGEDVQQKIARICASDPEGCRRAAASEFGNGPCLQVPVGFRVGEVPRRAPASATCTALPPPFNPPAEIAPLAAPRSLPAAAKAAAPTEREAARRPPAHSKLCADPKDQTTSRICAVLRPGR
ncbi:MAG TPA: hypothetical protein VI356_24715 [Myxococcales bacterium]